MKNAKVEFTALIASIQEAHKAKDHELALERTNEALEKFPCAPLLLVMKGIFLQLTQNPQVSLEAPLEWFGKALAFSAGEHHPLLESASYRFSVLNETEEALQQFRQLEEEAAQLHLQALQGQASCCMELGRKADLESVYEDLDRCFPGAAVRE